MDLFLIRWHPSLIFLKGDQAKSWNSEIPYFLQGKTSSKTMFRVRFVYTTELYGTIPLSPFPSRWHNIHRSPFRWEYAIFTYPPPPYPRKGGKAQGGKGKGDIGSLQSTLLHGTIHYILYHNIATYGIRLCIVVHSPPPPLKEVQYVLDPIEGRE